MKDNHYIFEKGEVFLWPLFFILLGFISIISQTTILREITTLFYGNEIFYCLGLGIWLFFTGIGSLLAKKIIFFRKKKFLWFILLILFLALPIVIAWLRMVVVYFIPYGRLPNLFLSLVLIIVTLSLYCFPIGLVFSLAAWSWKKRNKATVVNNAYFWETIGFVFGGIVFSYFLATTSFPLTNRVNLFTLSLRYRPLKQVFNSKHNQIIVTQEDKQKNIIIGGQYTFSTSESFETKHLISLIMPHLKKRNKAIVVGNPNIAQELKYNDFDQIQFIEIDEKLVALEKEIYSTGINFIIQDPRIYFNKIKEKYDLIIYSVGSPSTLFTNRYYTLESFVQIKNCLEEDGIFVLTFSFPVDYQSEEALYSGASIFHTLNQVFADILLFSPEERLVFLSGKKELIVSQKNVDTVSSSYFRYQMENLQKDEILQKFKKTTTKINSDFEPITYFYQQLYWQTIFNFRIPIIMLQSAKILPMILFFFLIIFLMKTRKRIRFGLLALSSSFILMSLETIFIFLFQTKIGYLYSQISFIYSLVLLGMTIGVILERKIRNFILGLNSGFSSFLFIILILFLTKEINISNKLFFWCSLGLISGLVAGLIFALINRLYLIKEKDIGYIYAFDLFGASLGALLTSTFLLPILGITGLNLLLIGIIIVCFFSLNSMVRI